jgi:Homeodomain-like domain
MRYSDRGGLSAEARSRREALRLEAAGMFAAGVSSGEIAGRLRVTRKSVNAWRRAWKAGGTAARQDRRARTVSWPMAHADQAAAAGIDRRPKKLRSGSPKSRPKSASEIGASVLAENLIRAG